MRIHRSLGIEPDETRRVTLAFLYFFFLLSSYYAIRPVRDEMGILAGVDQLQWLFTATFVVMLAVAPLFGHISARYPRRTLVPMIYLFFAASLPVGLALASMPKTLPPQTAHGG
ncbi:MAG: MFS transporter [Gammaproteobacteria bacterium]|nr:MFS transporter [Gammaproteobacteria bacterium]